MDRSPFHRLSTRAWVLWAKSGESGTDYMPLPTHMSDAGQVAEMLWGVWVPESARRIVWEALGDVDSEDVRDRAHRLAAFLAAAHDVGKASPAFASQLPALMPRIEGEGLLFQVFTLHDRRVCPHSWVSATALEEWAEARGIPKRRVRPLGAVLAGHHGIYPALKDLSYAGTDSRGGGDKNWGAVRLELLDAAAEAFGFSDDDLAAASKGLSQPAQLVLSGFVIVCDWIASNVDLFPLHRLGDTGAEVAEAALNALNLTFPWRAASPPIEELFRTRFDFPDDAEPRPVQLAAAELALRISQPEIIVIEAPTGEGKTEAAQAAAEILAARFGLGGVFFGLPTQATTDAMFARVLDWSRRTLNGQDVSISLSHGKAQFNRDFDRLRNPAVAGIWDDAGDWSGIRAHVWLVRKKAILANFVVGTIDQLLLMALQTRHVALRHLGLAGKVVILDEIHAADDFMFVYLVRALEWLAAHRVPVIALSATLPPARRRALIEAYARGKARGSRGDATPESVGAAAEAAQGFPLICTSDPAIENQRTQPSQMPTPAQVEFFDADTTLSDRLIELLTEGGCAAVVCNTVTRAQAAYAELTALFGSDVVLLHSRFITADRLTIESSLLDEMGPPTRAAGRPRRRIVVATQVIEQSLDLDFDVMVSDLAPLDLVFQRLGRLHRHVRAATDRPERLRRPTLLLRGVSQPDSGPPELDPGSVRVYGRSSLLRSLAVLREHLADQSTLSGVTDVADLVARAYAPDCSTPLGWEVVWAEAERVAAEKAADRERRASKFCVSAVKSGHLFGWMHAMIDEDQEAGHPAVRDIEDGIEAVVVVRGDDGRLVSLPWLPHYGGQLLDLGTQIEPGLARAVATCTVRFPAYVARGLAGDGIVRELEADGLETWQKSPWLRGLLPLVLGPDLTRSIQGWNFRYDRLLGLIVQREEALAHG